MANLDPLYEIDDRYKAFENHAEGILVSLAGPGTGKTFCILKRIDSLIKKEIDPQSISYITFIKEITNAFIDDFLEEFDLDNLPEIGPRISTLHSFACRLIRNRGFSVGYTGNLYFANVSDKHSFTSRIFSSDLVKIVNNDQLNTTARVRKQLLQVKKAWRNGLNPSEVEGLTSVITNAYFTLAIAMRIIDWDCTIPFAHDLYNEPNNRERWLTSIEHLLIDEYQDFNIAEQQFIQSFIANTVSAVIVGDDNQSIYRGRGGSPNGLRAIRNSPEVDHVSLVRSRRCKSGILSHVNTLLTTMSRDNIPLVEHDEGGIAECFKFKSSKAELLFLSKYLLERLDEIPDNPRLKDGIVCLFPIRSSLGFYLKNLRESVPCTSRNPIQSDSRDLLTLALHLATQPNQRFLERLLLEYFPAIKPRHKAAIIQLVIEKDISPTEAIQELINESIIAGTVAEEATHYINLCQTLSLREPESIARIMVNMLDPIDNSFEELLHTFFDTVEDIDQNEAVSNLCDQAFPETAMPFPDPHTVLFLTMHGAKGLTRRVVVMPGLEDAWLPGDKEGDDYAERQRLFYVALTRATDRVLITYPNHRGRNDPLNYPTDGRSIVSRFVTLAGIPDIYHD